MFVVSPVLSIQRDPANPAQTPVWPLVFENALAGNTFGPLLTIDSRDTAQDLADGLNEVLKKYPGAV